VLRLCAALVPLAAIAGLVSSAGAQSGGAQATERSIKAAYLYKFAEYVDWPEAAVDLGGVPFTIGVLGSSALADDLLSMTVDRRVDERPVRVRKLAPEDSLDDVQVLFVADGDRAHLGELLAAAQGRPILTVTETPGALADGSIINFTVVGARVRFEVSLAAAESSRLRLSSRLLAVAENVYGAP
jgi:hypothetical protein